MRLETIVTKAWQRQAMWLWLLLPLSWLYGAITALRCQAYKVGWLSSYRAPVPVMVIGNITVGGSGKTPLIISLVEYLQQQNIKVGVISRGYGGDSTKMPALVTSKSQPSIVGDEPCLIVKITGTPMAVCPNRQQAIETLLIAHPNLQLIIADDGLQHYALQRDIEWIVVDAERGFGNRQLLPTGFMREPVSRLKSATIVYHQRVNTVSCVDDETLALSRLTMHLQPDAPIRLITIADFESLSLINSIEPPLWKDLNKQNKIYAVSGIGYPQRFFDTLGALGFKVIEQPYPDHYAFTLDELMQYSKYPIIITSKDAVKIMPLVLQAMVEQHFDDRYRDLIARLWVLPVTAQLSSACYHSLDSQLNQLGIANVR